MTGNPPTVDTKQPQLVTPLLVDFVYVCQRLPEDQRRQWTALSFQGEPYDPDRAAIALAAKCCPKWCLVHPDGTPIAIGGYDMIREGVFQDWLIGTEEGWRDHWRAITKACNRVMKRMLETEAHRLQCVALADRTMAHKWFRSVGLKYEGTLRGYGYNGEDAVMYARTRSVLAAERAE